MDHQLRSHSFSSLKTSQPCFFSLPFSPITTNFCKYIRLQRETDIGKTRQEKWEKAFIEQILSQLFLICKSRGFFIWYTTLLVQSRGNENLQFMHLLLQASNRASSLYFYLLTQYEVVKSKQNIMNNAGFLKFVHSFVLFLYCLLNHSDHPFFPCFLANSQICFQDKWWRQNSLWGIITPVGIINPAYCYIQYKIQRILCEHRRYLASFIACWDS